MTGVLPDSRDDDSRDDDSPADNPVSDETVSEETVSGETVSDETVSGGALSAVASWASRAGAFTVDVLLGGGVVLVFLLVAWSARPYGWVWWLSILVAALVFLAVAANRVVLPVITGWSLGRSLFGIAVVRRDGRPLDPWLLLLRDLAHILDTVPALVGWFWPFWDSRGRTFADIVTRTEVHPVTSRSAVDRPQHRRLALRVLIGLAVLGLAGALLGLIGVYRTDKGGDRARTEIAEQGPKIVPDVLSYSAGSLDEDFKTAQALVADEYRPQLIAQQDAVRKINPVVDNRYWVTNSAVLSATDDHAQMLMFMQGQRGAAPKQRFITATVRASFIKSAKGQWQLADLNVLTKPVAPQAAPPAPGPGKSDAKPSEAPPAKPGEAKTPDNKTPDNKTPVNTPNPPKQGR